MRLATFPESLAHAAAFLESQPGIRWAALFGSHAKGTARDSSDVDIALCCAPRMSLGDELALAARLEEIVERTVDLVDASAEDVLLRFEIASSGRVLFERTPNLFTSFVFHAVMQYWDEGPMLERAQRDYVHALQRGQAR